jgi:hypothetical protein
VKLGPNPKFVQHANARASDKDVRSSCVSLSSLVPAIAGDVQTRMSVLRGRGTTGFSFLMGIRPQTKSEPLKRKAIMEMNTTLSKENLKFLSEVSLVAGLLSVLASIFTWFSTKDQDRGHAERFGIFIGLWVPSLLILSNRLSRLSEEE